MIARSVLRGASLALLVSFHTQLAFAQPATPPDTTKPGAAKPSEAQPADGVKSVEMKLDENAPASSTRDSAQDADAATPEAETDAAAPKRSPGLDFIKGRRKAASKDAAEPAEDEEERVERVERVERIERVIEVRPVKREEPPEPDDGLLGSHQNHFFLGIGPRIGFIANEGLDPFSTTDAFSQVAISGGRTLLSDGDLSLAAVLEWDYGVRSARARGLPTELGVHRVSLGAEGRYHLFRRFYGYVRVAPGALHTWATLNQLETTAWAFSADASLGAAFEMFGAKSGETDKPRGWVSVGGGYGFATDADLTLSPAEGQNGPERTASLELEPLSMSGPFVGGAVSLSY